MSYAVVRSYERERERRETEFVWSLSPLDGGIRPNFSSDWYQTFALLILLHIYTFRRTLRYYIQLYTYTLDTLHWVSSGILTDTLWSVLELPLNDQQTFYNKAVSRQQCCDIQLESLHTKSAQSSTIMSFIIWNLFKCRLQNKKYIKEIRDMMIRNVSSGLKKGKYGAW